MLKGVLQSVKYLTDVIGDILEAEWNNAVVPRFSILYLENQKSQQ